LQGAGLGENCLAFHHHRACLRENHRVILRFGKNRHHCANFRVRLHGCHRFVVRGHFCWNRSSVAVKNLPTALLEQTDLLVLKMPALLFCFRKDSYFFC
jgi:hypothetical protein